jgi:hypothetical protein
MQRNSRLVIGELRLHGFVPVAFREVYPDSGQIDRLWRYQANLSTSERLHFLNHILRLGPSIYVLFLDSTQRHSAPATVHLTYLKGPTVFARRKKHHLRTIAGPSVASVLSYLHASDDPADVVREMAVLLGRQAQAGIMAEASAQQDRTTDLLSLVKRLEAIAVSRSRALSPAADTAIQWDRLVSHAKSCRSFVSGETYRPEHAIVPDDKRLSLPLDSLLLKSEFGNPY